MKTIFAFLILLCPLISWAQTQTKSQCMATLRARSMSLSSADAEKICTEDSADVGNCVITKMQGSHRGGMEDAVKDCRSESSWGSRPSPTPTATPTPSVSPTSIKVPVSELIEDEVKVPKKSPDKKSEKKGTFEEL